MSIFQIAAIIHGEGRCHAWYSNTKKLKLMLFVGFSFLIFRQAWLGTGQNLLLVIRAWLWNSDRRNSENWSATDSKNSKNWSATVKTLSPRLSGWANRLQAYISFYDSFDRLGWSISSLYFRQWLVLQARLDNFELASSTVTCFIDSAGQVRAYIFECGSFHRLGWSSTGWHLLLWLGG